MGRNDMCFCESGKKQKKCHPNMDENSKAAEIIKLYRELDKELQEEIFQKLEFKCGEGCSECCEDFFLISEVEFAIIMDFLLRTKGQEEIQKYIDKGLELNNYFKEEYPDYYRQLEEDINGKESKEALRITLQNMPEKQNQKCIFLNSNNCCSVYEARPIICRTHGLCYRTDTPDDYKVCSKIPCLKHNKENMLCIDKYNESMTAAYIFKGKDNDKAMMRRQYPIFYLMKIYFRKELKMGIADYFKHQTIYRILKVKKENLYDFLKKYYSMK